MSQKSSTPGGPVAGVAPPHAGSTASSPALLSSLSLLQRSPSSYGSTDTSDTVVADGVTITVDRPTTPQVSVHGYSSSPRSAVLSLPGESAAPPRLSLLSKLTLFFGQLVSFFISSFFLSFVVVWASIARLVAELPKLLKPAKPVYYPWDDKEYHKKEKVVKDIGYYATTAGLDILDEQVETADGYFLRMHRVVNPRHKRQGSNVEGGFPVLILHGLFQSSGSFITSEERSLAFWLSERGGYQVFLGNTRGVFGMGHEHFSRTDPRFWDWTIRELAMYDFPAMIDYVRDATGYDKIAFIGHSQGNSLAFISLSTGLCPELGEKLSCFIALAPAVFAGPLTQAFPLSLMSRMKWRTWKLVFGVLDFIPLMRWSYDHVPPTIFAMMGYTMFAFIFQWTDTNWLKRRKTKMFQFTCTPVSSTSMFWWCGKGGFADRKCVLDEALPQWFDARFPPLSVYYGGRDFLVLAEPFLERIRMREPCVRLLRAEKIEASEHCDFYWAADAVEWCFASFVEDIEKTRPRHDDGDNST